MVLLALGGAVACGGSVLNGNGDGGKDGGGAGGTAGHGHTDGQPPNDMGQPDVGTNDSPSSETAMSDTNPTNPYDGTTGKACTTDADCHSAHGPNVARCSNSVFSPEDYYATAVCILPVCTPVSDTTIHYCDGPDAPSSPGICVPGGFKGGGICLPKCTYDDKGDAPAGCVGKDRCFSYTGGTTGGMGYCWGGCKVDADCQDGQHCQADEGLCVVGVVPPTKSFGAACTKSDTNTGVCNCLYGKADTGYCTNVCTVGDPTGCPTGATCDSIEFRSLGYSTPNSGMGGYCAVTCTADGGACPGSSSCTDVLAAGPDCVPP